MSTRTCVVCDTELGAASQQTRPYLSLPGMQLVGIDVYRCSKCGEEYTAIQRLAELDAVLVHAVASRPGRLTGEEIRFLRKHLGWSGADFAHHFDVDPSTVSRWETNKQQMELRAEQLLRTWVTRLEPVRDYEEFDAFLRKATQPRSEEAELKIHWEGHGWEVSV